MPPTLRGSSRGAAPRRLAAVCKTPTPRSWLTRASTPSGTLVSLGTFTHALYSRLLGKKQGSKVVFYPVIGVDREKGREKMRALLFLQCPPPPPSPPPILKGTSHCGAVKSPVFRRAAGSPGDRLAPGRPAEVALRPPVLGPGLVHQHMHELREGLRPHLAAPPLPPLRPGRLPELPAGDGGPPTLGRNGAGPPVPFF